MLQSPINQLKEISPDKRTIKTRMRRAERSTLRHAHRFIVQRLSNLREVRRHAIGWLVLIAALVGLTVWQQNATASDFTAEIPAEGGIFTEGVFGSLENLNPILASSPAELSGSHLLFAQLFTYDDKGDLVGELARSLTPEDGGRVYMLELKPNLKWQDGQPITADDVVFTFAMIKNADTHSPLYSSWRNIVVEKWGPSLVRFTLPAPYAAFGNSLTVGILPEHVLGDVRPSELRTAEFNTRPTVASGPFVFEDLNLIDARQMRYLLRLKANPHYVLGQPKLDGFNLHAYKERDDMLRGLRTQEVASISGASTEQLQALGDTESFEQTNSPLYNGTYAFLRTDTSILSDVRVRQALQYATDQKAILDLLNNQVQPLSGPLLPGQLGYRPAAGQPNTDLKRANDLLDAAGWVKDANGVRQKDGQPLMLRLVTSSTGEFPVVAEELMNQWQRIGVTFDSQLVRAEGIQQNVIAPRGYDVLIYEIAIGRDPDVYAYWHSSQATERGFNLSNYKSATVDEALDSGRTRLDRALRDAKYSLFVQEWVADAPAVALYRPTLAYVQNKNVVTFEPHPLVTETGHYYNVRYWAAGHEIGWPTR